MAFGVGVILHFLNKLKLEIWHVDVTHLGVQQDNSNMQIQSPWTEIGQHHREAVRENELRRICLCVQRGLELLSKRGNSG